MSYRRILLVLFKFNCTIRVIVLYGAYLTRSDALEEALYLVEGYTTAVDVISPAYYSDSNRGLNLKPLMVRVRTAGTICKARYEYSYSYD